MLCLSQIFNANETSVHSVEAGERKKNMHKLLKLVDSPWERRNNRGSGKWMAVFR
jgi:hypothetical protein